MRFIVKLIYNKYRQYIWDLLVEEFYGQIPKDLKQPALDFLAGGKEKLERAWSIQAYQIQRRSIMDPKNSDAYRGMLIILKAQMMALDSVSRVSYKEENGGNGEPKVDDILSGVEDFVKAGTGRFGQK